MKFLADQCTSMRTVRFLRGQGYGVITLEDLGQAAASDPDVIKLAAARDEILVTEDKDFGSIIDYPPQSHQGIILLRLHSRNRDEPHKNLSHFLSDVNRELLRNTLVVVTESTVRIRR